MNKYTKSYKDHMYRNELAAKTMKLRGKKVQNTQLNTFVCMIINFGLCVVLDNCLKFIDITRHWQNNAEMVHSA